MRILVVQESDWVERGPHQQHHLMERLQKNGHQIRVVDYEIDWRKKPSQHLLSRKSEFLAQPKICKGSLIRVIRPSIVRMPLLDLVSIPFTHGAEILRQIKSFKPDVVIGLGVLNTYITMRMCQKYGVPFAYYLIDALHTLIQPREFRLLGKLLEERTLRSSRRIFVINRQLKEYAINMGADPEKIVVLGAGVDATRFSPKVDGKETRRKYQILKNETVLFFMGWLYDFSGVREVAYSLMKHETTPKVKLLILGRGDLYEELHRLGQSKLRDKLILVDWQPYEKVPKYIAASDVCMLPALDNEVMRNIVPIKIYEYMACGKPVITTSLPGIVGEFGYGNGVIYVNRPEEVVDKTLELVGNRKSLQGLKLRAREYAQRKKWERIITEFEGYLRDVSNH